MRAYYDFFYKEIPGQFAKGKRDDQYVSREEFLLAVVASRRFDYDENDGKVFVLDLYLEPACRLNDFEDTDKNEVNDKLKHFVELALEKGVLKGVRDTATGEVFIRPKDQVTRAQAYKYYYKEFILGCYK